MKLPETNTDAAENDYGPLGQMTEKNFVTWSASQESPRAEFINGQVMRSAPASDEHDTLQWWCRTLIQVVVESRELGFVRGPNFQMRLTSERQRRTPDVMYVSRAREAALKSNHLEGPADLIVEVVSLDSKKRDRRDKFDIYQAAGISEYWLIDPLTDSLEAFSLVKERYVPIPNRDGSLASAVIPGLLIRPRWLWPKASRVSVIDALRELGVA